MIDTKRYSQRVAGRVRAELARVKMPKIALGEPLHLSESQIYARTTGRMPFTVDELAIIAELLGVDPSEFMPPIAEESSRARA